MTLTIIFALLAGGIALFLMQSKFGHLPQGKRKQRIQESPNYSKKQFQNLNFTPSLSEGTNFGKVLYKFFFDKSKRNKPAHPLPSQKTKLHNLQPDENAVVWFGHSSYFIQADGKTMLVDPVFSGHASPIKSTTKAFAGSDVYTVDDFPAIDYLFISHDHWDHLDYETLLKLKPKVKKVITGLGTAEHLERWGYDVAIIEERDWNESIVLDLGFTVHTTPARHFSGRGLKRNAALWMSFAVITPNFRLFLGGDSGYDAFFKEIGDTHGPFDLALLECGQYNEYWKYIHMLPEQVVTAAELLQAKAFIPVHWAKFALALHDWDEPIQRVTTEAEKKGVNIVTPMIGEKVNLDNMYTPSPKWWEGLE